jgi:Cu(I)/Ag(I) efflux system membrane fusion protein
VETDNKSGKLKPEMFATGIVSTTLKDYQNNIVIPKSAVLWTGKRSVVYVKQPGSDEPIFKLREIGLGPMLGESYVITDGLTDGEEIVTSGTFSVDAAAQLEGKPSMMNPQSGETSSLNSGPDKSTPHSLTHVSFEVSGNCEMCKDRIEKAARSIKGITSASWEISSKKLTIAFDSTLTVLEVVQKAIADAGHDNGKYKATDEVYNNLPECCLYRKE